MKWIDKLERKFGRYAIKNLTRYIILFYIVGYIMQMLSSVRGQSLLAYLTLNPYAILHGQVWRLVTWVLNPPTQISIFTVIMLICYYQLGTILERTWGAFRYNFYIFVGLIMTIIGSFVLYLFPEGQVLFMYSYAYGTSLFSTYYVSLSIFFGFAMTFPEQRMLFMFFIPIKIKWLALVDIAYLIYNIIQSFMYSAVSGMIITTQIVCALAGTIIYFIASRDFMRYKKDRQQQQRQKEFRKAMSMGQAKAAQRGAGPQNGTGAHRTTNRYNSSGVRHKCAICGQTDLDDPNLEFRYCSKCNGNYEYCQNHLFTHEHVK